MRTGAELVQASNAFTQEDSSKSWRLLLSTLSLYGLSMGVAAFAPWPLRLLGSVFGGLLTVRLFIFYHDYLHGAILRNSKLGGALMRVLGWWMLVGASVWRQTHDYHHKNNAKMLGTAIGSYPIVTVDLWRSMTPSQRMDYRIVRHPLTIFFGYFTVFILGMCISPFRRNPEQHKDGLIALLVHFSGLAALWALGGWQTMFLVGMLPQMMASGLGSYLFYAQHNFPGMQIRNRQDWDYSFAALKSSSMFDMGPVMHWFTGNIGYHHVHHLNHRIPFYRLPEAMQAMPELQSPSRTSWHPRDVWACLSLNLWNPSLGKMVRYTDINSDTEVAAK